METQSSVLPTNIGVENENQIEYASHGHPLTPCEIDEYCSICRETCLGRRTYGCNQCGLFLHESCTKIQIPQEIDHYFHPHPLRLALNESKPLDSRCEACGDLLLGLMYECALDCDVYHIQRLDVECALLPTKLKQDECIDHIQHFRHGHPLILCNDEKKYEKKNCEVCYGGLSTRPCFFSCDTSLLSEASECIYGCLRCQFFLHERCARLSLKIDSPFHRGHHSLALICSLDDPICQGCCRPCVNRYTYRCPGSCNFITVNTCNFILCVECAFSGAPILELNNGHYLTLFSSINPVLRCEMCNEACDSSNIFRCVERDYNLHLHCGPLPSSIKDKCHDDPLELMYAFVEEGYEDDTVYCDVCEQPRDPDECVYYCKACNFFAELKCVEVEVLASLNGERGNVKFRTANKTRIQFRAKLIGNVITSKVHTDSNNEIENIGLECLEVEENIHSGSYTDEECEQLIEIFRKARVQLLPSTSFREKFWIETARDEALCARIRQYDLALTELQSEGKQEFKTSIFCYLLDEESDNGENAITGLLSDDFKQLMRNLDSYYEEDNGELLEAIFCLDFDIVRIGEHKIVRDLASVLMGLLHEYGDFTAKSNLSERLKEVFLTMFCKIIHGMCVTNIREVDEKVLHKWWKALKLAQLAGFEIQFAIDQLYKVVRASFGMQAITSCREMKSWVDKTSDEIEEEEAKLEARKRELEAKKREYDELKHGIEYQSSPILKECLDHVSELKWKKAWDGSPIMFP